MMLRNAAAAAASLADCHESHLLIAEDSTDLANTDNTGSAVVLSSASSHLDPRPHRSSDHTEPIVPTTKCSTVLNEPSQMSSVAPCVNYLTLAPNR